MCRVILLDRILDRANVEGFSYVGGAVWAGKSVAAGNSRSQSGLELDANWSIMETRRSLPRRLSGGGESFKSLPIPGTGSLRRSSVQSRRNKSWIVFLDEGLVHWMMNPWNRQWHLQGSPEGKQAKWESSHTLAGKRTHR